MFYVNEQNGGLTIKTVAQRTGVSEHTLRAWERRYGIPAPPRGADNHYRLYGEQDIADVLFLKQQVDAGVSPAQASLILRLRQAPPNFALDPPAPPVESTRAVLLEALAASNESVARSALDEAFALFAPEQVALQIVEPTMREIGDRWMRGEMSVWQEHWASYLVQEKLEAVRQAQPGLPMQSPLLVAACGPAEEHHLGLTIFAWMAQRQGWRVAYLGAKTPLADLVDLARASKANAIAVSVTTPVGLAGLIALLDREKRPGAPLLFGGRMLQLLPALRQHLPGDYLGEDTLAAVRQLSSAKGPAHAWSPSRSARRAVESLCARRMAIAAAVTEELAAGAPGARRRWEAGPLNDATLFLIDSLLSALAFDAPELMDQQGEWLVQALPPRSAAAPRIVRHLRAFQSRFSGSLAKEDYRLYAPLIERLIASVTT